MINVTQSFLPPIHEYMAHVQRAYNNQWLTNRGELVLELEEKLKKYLGLSNILITNNGTIPIQIALKLLGKGGEIITTPFSYVATTSSVIWENCTPVFVDIHDEYLTIDETKIEAAITKNTSCILATHVFGNPCNVEAIEMIAKKHNLHVIYDAAHCFGVTYNGQSVFNYGTVSTCSFHATKVFHTGEGGAVICNQEELSHKIYYSHNFGHDGPLQFFGIGINAKISELQAAMGLSVLPYMDTIIEQRKEITLLYDSTLPQSLIRLKIRPNTSWNYCYYPVIFPSEELLLIVDAALKAQGITARRYFYPSLNNLPYVQYVAMPVSDAVASKVLCLPIYAGLPLHEVSRIVNIINMNF
jgi:dTDP-4-amino-4,6-dideoxygalactose transaminase